MDYLEFVEILGFRDPLECLDQKEAEVEEGAKELRGREGNQALQELKVNKERKENQDQGESWACRAEKEKM